MLLSDQAPALGLLSLCLMVYVSLALNTSHNTPESAAEKCNFKMTFRKYRLILSWELKNRSVVPTYYTFGYTIMSKREGMKTVENCTNITRSFCDLTDVWQDMPETYIPMVKGFRGETLLVLCLAAITNLDLSFEPPDFRIVGYADHINVSVQFPPVAPKIYGEELHRHASLIIEEHSEDIDKRHEPKISGSFSGNFSYVINNLIPNTNYCVSVYFEPRNSRIVIKPPLKCVLLQLPQESGSSKSIKIIVFIVIFISVAISIILILKQIGYVCLHTEFPKALIFRNFVVQIFPERPLSEEVNMLEVISVHRKKKVWDYNYDDESDTEDEAPLRTNARGYTMHGLTGRLLSQFRPSSASSQASHPDDPADEESEEPDKETEPLFQPLAAQGPSPGQREGQRERAEGLPHNRSPKDDDGNSTGGSGDKITFNVDLKSVFLRALHDDAEDSEEAALVLPPQEEDPQETESSLLVPHGKKLQVLFPSLPPGCLWTGGDLSDKSDTTSSGADDDVRDGYIMR